MLNSIGFIFFIAAAGADAFVLKEPVPPPAAAPSRSTIVAATTTSAAVSCNFKDMFSFVHHSSPLLQAFRERCGQELGELRRKQEELVEAAIRENMESEMRVLMKNEERVEGVRRENQEREEKAEKEGREAEEKQRKENQEREEKAERESREAEEKVRKENKAREEKVKQENEEALAALTNQKKEKAEQVRREKEEGDQQVRRENKELEEEQKRRNEESLALLLSENEVQMARMMAKQDEEERVSRKRKATDQLETNKYPAAPACPVCAWTSILVSSKILFIKFIVGHRCALSRCCPPPRSSSAGTGVTSSARLASELVTHRNFITTVSLASFSGRVSSPHFARFADRVSQEEQLEWRTSSRYHKWLLSTDPGTKF